MFMWNRRELLNGCLARRPGRCHPRLSAQWAPGVLLPHHFLRAAMLEAVSHYTECGTGANRQLGGGIALWRQSGYNLSLVRVRLVTDIQSRACGGMRGPTGFCL